MFKLVSSPYGFICKMGMDILYTLFAIMIYESVMKSDEKISR